MATFDPTRHLKAISDLYRAGEEACLDALCRDAELTPAAQATAETRARRWVTEIRRTHKPSASVTDLLSRFGLSSQEGIALMCLAEALLRVPDRATADALIRDKLSETHWNEALGTGVPWTMNAAGWALSLTGTIIDLDDPLKTNPGAAITRLISRLGQPVIREALRGSMRWLADQFVTGETIEDALERARGAMQAGVRYSFDMLGEGARTAEDAARFQRAYEKAIDAIGSDQRLHNFQRPSGISVKLSALHPRYEMVQRERVMREMMPALIGLCERAAKENLPVTIDAEEADRLQLSLEVAAALFERGDFGSWEGLGFAVQAYQKRAPAVIDYLGALAEAHDRKIHIRLVKGAYWDTEIKRAQERGWDDFPVFTRKAATDVSYLACARRLLKAGPWVTPMFGTHNAMTIAHILEEAPDPQRLEFQQLHGMNEDLYRIMRNDGINAGVYAPVGDHDVLLGYLVRRILENGANSSFIHKLLDPRTPIDKLTLEPKAVLETFPSLRNPKIRRPPDLYMPERRNSSGLDLTDPFVTGPLLAEMTHASARLKGQAAPRDGETQAGKGIDEAFVLAEAASHAWMWGGVERRAVCLEKLALLLERETPALLSLLVGEGGKTIPDAVAEIREAVDYCRYYPMRAREDMVPKILPGPVGERNELVLQGRGVFVCISPWNFPLAIFLGQVAAALVAGNAVIAKPAPQTPRIALFVARLMKDAGFPENIFHVIPGGPECGAELVGHPKTTGVAFTGSTRAAQSINRALAAKSGPITPLIAETGGQNAMIVDTSALPEQVIDDVVTSAFRSAGQRCSALRILCIAEPVADKILTMLKGAMTELHIGDPGSLETDIGPVIDKAASDRLRQHRERLKADAREICTVGVSHQTWRAENKEWNLIAPQAWEIPKISWLEGEVFGPILHVVRFRPDKLSDLLSDINATGFGLTGGVHSRIDTTVSAVERDLKVGNLYINRSIIGAVVGVQPFGGDRLSGTGPKAGGPNYLARFTVEHVASNNITAAGGNATLMAEEEE